MASAIETILLLLAVLVIVAVVARRLNTAPSILLVIAGIVLALVPGLPRIELAPELVLLGILPPLIYSAGVAMSWREFRFNLRPIALFAFRLRGLHHLRGGGRGALAARHAARRRFRARRHRVAARRGGAAGHRHAARPAAPARRHTRGRRPRQRRHRLDPVPLRRRRGGHRAVFASARRQANLRLIVVGEIAYGIAVGWCSLRLRRWAHDPRVEITLSLMTPYVAFLVPQQLGGSGVLATVAAGLFVSWNGPLLIPAATRLQGIFFWDLLIYLLEGFVFLVTGMQTRTLLNRADTVRVAASRLRRAADRSDRCRGALHLGVSGGLSAALAQSGAARAAIRCRPGNGRSFSAFVGVRGVVSLAAALAMPFFTDSGAAFPDRDLILFVTFGLIIVTLVGQGLTLPMRGALAGLGKTRRRRTSARARRRTCRARRRFGHGA